MVRKPYFSKVNAVFPQAVFKREDPLLFRDGIPVFSPVKDPGHAGIFSAGYVVAPGIADVDALAVCKPRFPGAPVEDPAVRFFGPHLLTGHQDVDTGPEAQSFQLSELDHGRHVGADPGHKSPFFQGFEERDQAGLGRGAADQGIPSGLGNPMSDYENLADGEHKTADRL